MKEKHFTLSDIQSMEKRHRAQLINSLPGFKSANLIGTANKEGQTNLAVFSSIVHLGANPALMGFVMRPVTVPRHTYSNIKEIKYYTVNNIGVDFFKKAHQTSARFDASASEFDGVGLTAEYVDGFPAPFVKESKVKIGLEYVEEYPIRANGTILIVGKIIHVCIPEEAYSEDGYVDHETAGSVAISGLDGYHQTNRLARLAYAKVDKEVREIE